MKGGKTSSYIFHPTSAPRLKSTGPSQSRVMQMEAGVKAGGHKLPTIPGAAYS